MATRLTTESTRNDTETVRTPDTWTNQVHAFFHANREIDDAEATVADTTGSARAGETEHHVVETEPTYTDLSNYYTKLNRPEEH